MRWLIFSACSRSCVRFCAPRWQRGPNDSLLFTCVTDWTLQPTARFEMFGINTNLLMRNTTKKLRVEAVDKISQLVRSEYEDALHFEKSRHVGDGDSSVHRMKRKSMVYQNRNYFCPSKRYDSARSERRERTWTTHSGQFGACQKFPCGRVKGKSVESPMAEKSIQ